MNEGESKKTIPIKRRDIGIAGSLIVLTEIISSLQSTKNVATEIQNFKEEFLASKIEREQYFVRKVEVEVISQKLDKMNDQLNMLNNHVIALRSYLKTKFGYSVMKAGSDYVCQDLIGEMYD